MRLFLSISATAHHEQEIGATRVSLTIPAKAEYITLGRLALTGLLRPRSLPEETVGDLKLALTEACTNSVRHAYPEGSGAVQILYELRADRVVIEVSDDGRGFDYTEPVGDEDELTEGGLGIAIIRSLADEFELAGGVKGHGSRLRFVKLLSE